MTVLRLWLRYTHTMRASRRVLLRSLAAFVLIACASSVPGAQAPAPAAQTEAPSPNRHMSFAGTRPKSVSARIRPDRPLLHRALVRDQGSAPDLVAFSPPPPDVYGYQVVGKVGTDGPPPASGTKSHVVSFSWNWSDTMIERQLTTLEG